MVKCTKCSFVGDDTYISCPKCKHNCVPLLEMYLNSSTDFSIEDDKGKTYTPEEARAVAESGNMRNCNIAFQRLMREDYNLDAVKKFYKDNPK